MFAARPRMILGPCFYDLNKSICVCVWTQKNKKRRKFAEADNGKPSVTDRLHITQKLRLKKCSGESIIKVKLGAINPLKATYNHFFLIFDWSRAPNVTNYGSSGRFIRPTSCCILWRLACRVSSFCDVGNLSEVFVVSLRWRFIGSAGGSVQM